MILAYACNEPPEILDKDITVPEVQSLYNEISATNSNGRQTNDVGIMWEEATYKEISLGDALFFPLDSTTNRYVRLNDEEPIRPIEEVSHAFAYKTPDGETHLDLVHTISTQDTEEFTGYVTVSDWNGDSGYTIAYENGQVVESPTSGRAEGCTTTHYFDCTTVLSGGEEYTHCEYAGSTIHCGSPPDIFAPSDPTGDGGGGGGKGGGTTSLCPHPTIDGEFIVCGSCDIEGFSRDENGNCVRNIDLDEISLDIDDDPYCKLNDCVKAIVNEDMNRAWDLYMLLNRTKNLQIETFGSDKVYVNNCADAFRHALFGAMATRDFGIDLARRIGIANECDVPDNLVLEEQMDLHNNEVGYQVGLDYGSSATDSELALAIWVEITRGNLKYLSNINYQDSCFWGTKRFCDLETHGITPETELVCSNVNCTDI